MIASDNQRIQVTLPKELIARMDRQGRRSDFIRAVIEQRLDDIELHDWRLEHEESYPDKGDEAWLVQSHRRQALIRKMKRK